MIWYILSMIAYIIGFLILSFVGFLWWIRPFKVSPDVPGPKRHWFLGIMFGDDDDFVSSGSDKDLAFDWNHWPTLSLSISRRYNFQTWGGPTPNVGFGGAFFNVGKDREKISSGTYLLVHLCEDSLTVISSRNITSISNRITIYIINKFRQLY